jgi:hypothetical protein
MKLSKIQELLRLVAESGVSEVEIEEDDFKLTIRQNSPQVLMQPRSYPAQMSYGPPQGMPQQAPPQQPPAPSQPQQPAPAGGAHANDATGPAPPDCARGPDWRNMRISAIQRAMGRSWRFRWLRVGCALASSWALVAGCGGSQPQPQSPTQTPPAMAEQPGPQETRRPEDWPKDLITGPGKGPALYIGATAGASAVGLPGKGIVIVRPSPVSIRRVSPSVIITAGGTSPARVTR